jgi:hypothetical protein
MDLFYLFLSFCPRFCCREVVAADPHKKASAQRPDRVKLQSLRGKTMQTETVVTPAPTPDAPSPAAPSPLAAWFARLGLSGKILTFAALAGIIAVFLPLLSVSMSVQMPGIKINQLGVNQPGLNSSKTTMVVEDWRGQIALVGYIAALALAFVLYPPKGLGQKALCWAGLGAGALVALLALWALIVVLNAGSNDLMGMAMLKISPGIGAFLNLAAGIGVAVGAFLKTREEKLI